MILKLSVVIPTRNRASFLDETLGLFAVQVMSGGLQDCIELVCVDNQSQDATSEVVKRYAREASFIKYFRHDEYRETAELSLFHAIKYASNDLVWCFGDDDIPKVGALKYLLDFFSHVRCDFLLLNPLIQLPDSSQIIEYFDPTRPVEFFNQGVELFKKYGLVSATTTISCLVIRKSAFQLEDALEFAGSSQVYSHSISLLNSYFDRPCAVLFLPILTYRQNSFDAEGARFAKFCTEKGILPESIFTTGLLELIRKVSARTGIPFKSIVGFIEPEMRKDIWRIAYSPLWVFIFRFAYQRLINVADFSAGRLKVQDFDLFREVYSFLGEVGRLRLRRRYLYSFASAILLRIWRKVNPTIYFNYPPLKAKRLSFQALERELAIELSSSLNSMNNLPNERE